MPVCPGVTTRATCPSTCSEARPRWARDGNSASTSLCSLPSNYNDMSSPKGERRENILSMLLHRDLRKFDRGWKSQFHKLSQRNNLLKPKSTTVDPPIPSC